MLRLSGCGHWSKHVLPCSSTAASAFSSTQVALAYFFSSTSRHVQPSVPSGAPFLHSPASGVEYQMLLE